MRVFVSNRLETLADVLKEELFQKDSHPLSKRWVVVPSKQIQQALLLRWAEELKIAMGIKMITWSSALRCIFPDIPSKMELSLKIEIALEGIEEVIIYLQGGGPQRKLSLCDRMSGLFLQYLAQPKIELQGWQKILWNKVFGDEMPWKRQKRLEGDVYLFQCSEMASYQLEAFKKMETTTFLFSPCALYWGDLQTFREQQFLLKKAHEKEKEELSSYFKNDHPLLANWGKRGRDLLEIFEEVNEVFEEPLGGSLLTTVQKEMLTLDNLEKKEDASIQLHSAPSRLREVEVVWEIIQGLPYLPSEILVLAPDIQLYAPLIEMVFRQRGGPFDYAIFGLQAKVKSPLMQGFKDLLDLPRYRFSKEAVEKLLFCPPFLERFKLTQEEVRKLQKWFSQAHIRYDLGEGHPGTWTAGAIRLVEALVVDSTIEFSEADLLSRWIGVIQSLEKELSGLTQEKSLREWATSLRRIVETFFVVSSDDDYLMRELERLYRFQVEGVFHFSSLERILQSVFEQNIGVVQGSHLQAVKFGSLEKGALMSAKAIILMGMDEGSFPRQESPSSLQQMKMPPVIDDDRYLFLEALCHARKTFAMTFTRLHPEDGKSQKPSSLVEELCRYCSLSVKDHPFIEYGMRKFLPQRAQRPQREEKVFDIRMLKKLARHPLQYFFEEGLGIRFEWEEKETEFVLSPLELAKLRKGFESIEKFEKEGRLPVGRFAPLAIDKIKKEIEAYRNSLEKLGVSEIYTIELKRSCKAPLQIDSKNWIYPALSLNEVIIEGKIDELSPQGLLHHGDESLPDLLKVWPLYLIVKQLSLPHPTPLLLTKKGKAVEIEKADDALHRYVMYAEKALSSPSPLFPRWARGLFNEGKIPEDDDHIIQWAQARRLLPDSWGSSWNLYLQEIVRELI